MADYPIYHGIQLANNSEIRNAVVERLTADISSLVEAGRFFYNTTDRKVKVTALNDLDAVILESLVLGSDIVSLEAKFSGTGASQGASLVGYAGQTGAKGFFSLPASSVESAIDATVVEIDNFRQLVDTYTVNAASTSADLGSAMIGYSGRIGTHFTVAAGTVQSSLTSIVNQINSVITTANTDRTDTTTNYLNKTTATAQTVVSNVTFDGDVTVNNLTVAGTTTTVNSETVAIADNILMLNSNVVSGVATENAGLSVMRGDAGELTFIRFNETTDTVQAAFWDATANAGAGGFVMLDVASHAYVQQEAVTKINNLLADLASAADGDGAELVAYAGHAVGSTSVSSGTVDSAIDELVALVEASKSSGTTVTDSLQAEVDAIEASVGLTANGVWDPTTYNTTNYLTAQSSVLGGVIALDARAKTTSDALSSEISRATTAESDLQGQIDANATAISTETSRATAAEGTISANLASEVTRLEGEITASSDSSANLVTSLKNTLNANQFTYKSTTAASVHTIPHNLGSEFVDYKVLVQGDDLVYRGDITLEEEVDNNTLRVTMTEARNIKVAIQAVRNV